MFFNFPSVFITIQPALLENKLQKTQVESFIITWITYDLTKRPQFVRLNGCVSVDWRHNTDAIYKKGPSRRRILRKLRSFNFYSRMLQVYLLQVLQVCCGEYSLICSHLLGEQHQSQ